MSDPTEVRPARSTRHFYVDGRRVDSERDLEHELDHWPPPRTLGSMDVAVVSLGRKWRDSAECLRNDEVLNQVIRERVSEFDLEFALQTGVMETCGPAADDGLARLISSRLITPDYLCHISETYLRFFRWVAVCGGAPFGYVKASLARSGGEMDDAENLCDQLYTREQVLRATQKLDRQLRSFTPKDRARALSTGMGTPSDVFAAALGPEWDVWQHAPGQAAAVPPPDPETNVHAARGALAALRVVKALRDGFVPYVPRVEHCDLYCALPAGKSSTPRWTAVGPCGTRIDEWRWVTGRPTVRRRKRARRSNDESVTADFLSAVGDGAEQSRLFRVMRSTFGSSIIANSRRALVVGPSEESSATREHGELLRSYMNTLMERYPQQVYDDLIGHAVNQGGDDAARRLLTDTSTSRLIPREFFDKSSAPGSGYGLLDAPGTASMLSSHEEHAKRRVLSELWATMRDEGTKVECYRALTDYLDALNGGNAVGADRAFRQMTPQDKDRVRARLVEAGCLDTSGPSASRPDVHTVGSDGARLVASYTTNVNLTDMEELMQLWTLQWKARLSGSVSLYSKRHNHLQYNSQKAMQDSHGLARPPDYDLRQHFCALSQCGTAEMSLLRNTTQKQVQVSELFIIEKLFRKTTGVKAMLAKSLGMLPAEVSLMPQMPEEPAEQQPAAAHKRKLKDAP